MTLMSIADLFGSDVDHAPFGHSTDDAELDIIGWPADRIRAELSEPEIEEMLDALADDQNLTGALAEHLSASMARCFDNDWGSESP